MFDGPNSGSGYPISGIPDVPPVGGGGIGVFDSPEAMAINDARMKHLDSLGLPIAGKTVLDVGCGVGHLARYFADRKCRVVCVDGREENIAMLRGRYPDLEAHVANVEADSLGQFGQFDIVFCYGLLYHLENPVGGLRNISQVCKDLLLLETVVSDWAEPVLRLLDEPPSTLNQSLGSLGCRPSPAYVALALTRAGFRYVYAPKSNPEHPDFQISWRNDMQSSRDGHLLRCVFVASNHSLDNPELSLLVENPNSGRMPFVRPAPVQSSKRIWLDVGAHLGEKTFAAAKVDASLRVYAFEPNLSVAAQKMGQLANFIMLPVAVAERDGSATFHLNRFAAASSLLGMVPEGLQAWQGGDELTDVSEYAVPTIRLDTFLDRAGITAVDFLKIDAQGADLAVVRSAGERLKEIQKISLEVQITPVPLYEGGSRKEDVIRYLTEAGFQLTGVESQSHGQEENLTFDRLPEPSFASEDEALAAATSVAYVRPLVPYPGWTFGADWDNPDPAFRSRRRIWEYFNLRRSEKPLIFEWYEGLRLHLFLGNDLSRQMYIAGCTEPNEMAFLDEVLERGSVFVDGGANDGVYTLFASHRVGTEGRILAFEPSSREFARLKQNLALNPTENTRAFHMALADRNGEEDLRVAGYEHEGQNTLGEFVHNGVERKGIERVLVRKLDDVIIEENLTRVDVIKLDVEGAETRVLEGARNTLQRFRPIVLFEALDPALRKQGSSIEQLIGVFALSAYKLYAFGDQTGRPTPITPAVGSCTIVCLPNSNIVALPDESPLVSKFGLPDQEAGTGGASPLREGNKGKHSVVKI